MSPTQVVPAQTRGFCAGVTRAIEIVERALALQGATACVFHEIAHNRWMVSDLRSCGAVFVASIERVPVDGLFVFSARGVPALLVAQARRLGLRTIEATIALVSMVHQQAQRFSRMGHVLLMIGHAGHEEAEGTLGRVNASIPLVSTLADVPTLDLPADAPVACVTQTTLSLDDTRDIIAALGERFAWLVGPDVDQVCCATRNRQFAVRALAARVNLALVVGARNSFTSHRLRELAKSPGVPAHLVQDETEIRPNWLQVAAQIGVTSCASAPELLVQQVVGALHARHDGPVLPVLQLPGVREDVLFRLPAELAEPVR